MYINTVKSMTEENDEFLTIPKKDLILPDVEPVKLSERGGSLQITIPKGILKMLGWKEGDLIKYIVNKKDNFAIIVLKEQLEGAEVIMPLFGKTSFKGKIIRTKSKNI